MIAGIGNDICDVRRIRASFERHGERFIERILGPQEQAIWRARTARSPERGVRYLATRFSAKEAFSKAVGLGIHHPMRWRDCQVLNAASGKPELHLSGDLAAWFNSQAWKGHVSISDETDYAAAFVVVEHILDLRTQTQP